MEMLNTIAESEVNEIELRDYFAAKALAAIVDDEKRWGDGYMIKVAKKAYQYADAMLAARADTGEDK